MSAGTTLRPGSLSLTQKSQCGGPSDDMLCFMMHYLELAYCHEVFLVLCMLSDERLDSKFQFVVGAFRKKFKNGQVVAPLLVKNIMAYAHYGLCTRESVRDKYRKWSFRNGEESEAYQRSDSNSS